MIDFKVTGDTAVSARLSSLPDRLRSSLKRAISAATLKLEAKVKGKLSGSVLNVRSGALRRSVFSKVTDDPSAVIGRVASSGDVKYAAIHEFGGTIHHPGGTPYMVLQGEGVVFISNEAASNAHIAGRTQPHDIIMPERSFLRSSLAEDASDIKNRLQDAVREAHA